MMTEYQRERAIAIIALDRFGFSLKEIGAAFGISSERVRQIKAKQERRARKELGLYPARFY